jgi:lipopolysaccharide export system protein LptA
MTDRAGQLLCVLVTALGLAAASAATVQGAAAQTGKQSPLFKASPQNKNQPVKIQAASLEVRDKDKRATFTGNVVVIQGETEVRCNTLIVYYEGELAKGKSGAAPAATGKGKGKDSNQQIRRMEARGNVIMIQKDQRATGEQADFDVRANTVTVIGNVVVTSGESVLRGQQLFVDLTSGVSRMESGGGRVEALIPQKGKGPNAADNPGERRPRRPK